MDITIFPTKLSGTIHAIPSKSQAHRLLICAAFADAETTLICPQTNQDIEATADCLRSLGADIVRTDSSYIVKPVKSLPKATELHCRESGSTLRFILPIVGALGIDSTFLLEGRLPYRPLSPLWEEMERWGCTLSRPTESTIRCTGKLQSENFTIDGSVSSQFITGLLFAMALMPSKCSLTITGKLESKPYIEMTQAAMAQFGVSTEQYIVSAGSRFISPKTLTVEGDWSNGAFFLAANAIGNKIDIKGLCEQSPQGDRTVADILPLLRKGHAIVDSANIPDLVPILAVAACAMHGATFTNISRLRLKESDRVATVQEMLSQLGARTMATENELHIYPAHYIGCTVNSACDHRIAMSAAIAATIACGPVTIKDAQCVSKSYPAFWDEYRQLGGHYEQHIW